MRLLRVHYDSVEQFQRDYTSNLVNGGVFVPTDQGFELRERVRVELSLGAASLVLDAEVVHIVSGEMAAVGGAAGVALQFEGSAHEVRARLEPLRKASGVAEHRPVDPGRRRAPRSEARVPARVRNSHQRFSGVTQDLSLTGVLVSVSGKGLPAGESVCVALTHPENGETLEVGGVVVREVRSDGTVTGLAIDFAPEPSEREELERFVESILSTEHTRRLGGISGSIEELGIPGLLQMLGRTAPSGTLTLRTEGRQAQLGFEGGELRYARLGAVGGMKALVRLLAWTSGSFEFHARLDPSLTTEDGLPIEAALFDAMRMLDERSGWESEGLDVTAKPMLTARLDPGDPTLTRLEAAVVELALADFSFGRMLEVIPEPDPEIERALVSLRERGLVRF